MPPMRDTQEWPALWTPALPPHTLENIGDTEVRVVNFELKDRR